MPGSTESKETAETESSKEFYRALVSLCFYVARQQNEISVTDLLNDLEKIILKNDHGRHGNRHQRARVIADLFFNRETEAISIEEIAAKLGDINDQKAAHRTTSRFSQDLEDIQSEYELVRMSVYYFRKRRKS